MVSWALCRFRHGGELGFCGSWPGGGCCGGAPDGCGPGWAGLRGFNGEERPGSGRLRGNHTRAIPGTGALFAMQHMPWDHALKVTGGGSGLVGHAGAILLRKAADQAGLTGWLSAALQKAGKSPVFDRGVALVSMAAAIAVGAASMSDI